MTAERRRLLIALIATVALLAPLGYYWQASLLPDRYSVMDMGYADYGGGPATMTHHELMGRRVASLVADPKRPADVRVTLTARKERFRLASGEQVDGYTVNGTSPGPVIRAVQGQLVEVVLVNESVPSGVTLHWHGVDVPNAADGVAGVTQDAVRPGKSFTYRFVADHVGTYWYHSHQVSHAQVQGGLLGGLVVTPPKTGPDVRDELAMLHVYDGKPTINGSTGDVLVDAADGETVRVRVVNTDNGATSVWTSGSPFTVMAVDGYDLHEPTPVSDRAVRLTAGGRVDLQVTAPARIELGGARALIIGQGARAVPQPTEQLDLLTYGTPAPLGFDPSSPERMFTYSVGRRPGFLDGRPGLWWSINGHLFPDVPMFVVEEGDVVTMHIDNHSSQTHPMHLHGHHAVVMARNGVKATGSPWWVDSLDVANGDSYDIAFVADNPGIWMDHCHNLPHAAQGLVAHLMYAGLTEPYRVGGDAANEPE
ncbi:MAG: multicopper oxidase family protein [Sporichthyaceae bacterium]